MAFNSIEFLMFFSIVVIIYFLISHKFQWIWLLVSSYCFYITYNYKYLILLLTTTIITYISGLLIEKADGIKSEALAVKLKKIFVFISFSGSLFILFLFKYYNFFSNYLKKAFSLFNISIHTPAFNYVFPIGISFYTFKALSYTMDVYRKDVKAEKNFGKYALFVSFFPQIVSGPIEKSKDFIYQIDEKHSFEYDRVKNGLILILWGLVQKMVIADRLAILVDNVFSKSNSVRGFEVVIGSVFFTFQIYCDFSAYSNISIGLAQILGFRVPKNFERPYFSKTIKEFWRRWHITLGAWFKDYLYIPLGGNRCSKLRYYFNIMIVFILSGLWHGSAVNFIIWGTLHGIYQIIGDMLKPVKKAVIKILKIEVNVFSHKLFRILVTFILVDFAWIFFRASSLSVALKLIEDMMHFNPWIFIDGSIYKLGLMPADFTIAVLGIGTVLIVDILGITGSLLDKLARQNILFRWSVYLSSVFIILIFGIYGPGYSAQQFIYLKF